MSISDASPLFPEKQSSAAAPILFRALPVSQEQECKMVEVVAGPTQEEIQTLLDAVRAETRSATILELQEHYEQKLVQIHAEIEKTILLFQQQKKAYFKQLEQEAVGLTLAIVRKILLREAKLDPLLLEATVHVALEKVADHSATTLYVPMGTLALWKDRFQTSDYSVTVLEDESLEMDGLRLETSVGTVELGISSQLQEIERGFFDLLTLRSGSH